MTFNSLKQLSLQSHDLHEEVSYIYNGFLVESAITMIYAQGGSGKSYFALKLCDMLLSSAFDKNIIYIDFDNSKQALKERGLETLLEFENFAYIYKSNYPKTGYELLLELQRGAVGRAYRDYIFVFDSLRDFCDGDIGSDTKMRVMMEAFKNLREAGASVIILHHTTKNGINYQGSVDLRNSADNIYRLELTKSDECYFYALTHEKDRYAIDNIAFACNGKLRECSIEIARLGECREFVTQIVSILSANPNINQKTLLKYASKSPDDVKAREVLDAYNGVFWNLKSGAKNSLLYSISDLGLQFLQFLPFSVK